MFLEYSWSIILWLDVEPRKRHLNTQTELIQRQSGTTSSKSILLSYSVHHFSVEIFQRLHHSCFTRPEIRVAKLHLHNEIPPPRSRNLATELKRA